eukprot:g2013.t1
MVLPVIQQLPAGSNDDLRFEQFLQMLVARLKMMMPGDMFILPGGWSSEGDANHTHMCVYILQRRSDDRSMCRFAVCNTGDGDTFHPARVDIGNGKIRRMLSLEFDDVPFERVRDSSFWFMVYRLLVYPSPSHGPRVLYEALLPHLSLRPVVANARHACAAAGDVASAPHTGADADGAVLDYGVQLRQQVRADHVVFQFEHSMDFGVGDHLLMDQLCLYFGYSRDVDQQARFFGGEDPLVVDNLPELAAFRNLVFMFKIMMQPTSDALPALKRWMPTDAALAWRYKKADAKKSDVAGEVHRGTFNVNGFGRKLQGAFVASLEEDEDIGGAADGDSGGLVADGSQHAAPPPLVPTVGASAGATTSLEPATPPAVRHRGSMSRPTISNPRPRATSIAKRAISGFRAMFGKSKPRAPSSGGDPSNLVGQRIDNEEDILHIRHLPDFGGRLKARDCELMLSYLTAPYVRIPLLMNFFSDPMRLTALLAPELQDVLDACLFEPGVWQPDGAAVVSLQAPMPIDDRQYAATPVGLLFNELKHTPHVVAEPVDRMLEQALEMDSGRPAGYHVPLILYVIRLAVRVEGYILFITRHADYIKSLDKESAPERITGSGWASHVRGLLCEGGVVEQLRGLQERLRARLDNHAFPMLERWCAVAVRNNQIQLACSMYAHLSFVYQNVAYDGLDPRIVSVLVIAQVFVCVNYRFDVESKENEKAKKRVDAEEETVSASLSFPQMELFDVFQRNRSKVVRWLEHNANECNEVMEAVTRAITFTGGRHKPRGKRLKARQWRYRKPSYAGHELTKGYAGHFVPDTEYAARSCEGTPSYEEWLRETTTQSVDTEIDLQLGQFTLKKHAMRTLDDQLYQSPDFAHIFGTGWSAENPMQCAEVKHSEHRRWDRLVGRRHDIQCWHPDSRVPPNDFKRPMVSLAANESWVRDALEPYLRQGLKNMDLFLPKNNCGDNPVMVLKALHSVQQEDGQAGPATLKEVLVFRKSHMVHVYRIIEYGRRRYRTLIFTSDPALCYHDMRLTHVKHDSVPCLESGNMLSCPSPESSVVITRQLTKRMGIQTFIPARLLYGLSVFVIIV